ncbi:MAG: aromatic ring-hydroxylating dioxygenase subunit alpha [Planctomycetota bacterium]|nr:aromatic ring-hydroxylating dioxygenase subunit alpha [Planctomycetota bacterium]MDA1251484.1 aromatic ring-hydroxylating dioxygenase subunit alpha [Planctomycetota bacterium]
MFISEGHLPQVLPPEAYTSQKQLDLELKTVFDSVWQCVGAKNEFPRDGDFKTVQLLEHEIIIWRRGSRFQTFLNVCAHRYCTVTSESCGNAPERLRCQYHGWEFDETGNTRKIPDSPCFKPLKPGVLGLQPFRTETCGQLIFVTLSESTPSLRDFLGDTFDVIAELFHQDLFLMAATVRDVNANWKVLLENSLESYHVEECHPSTLGPLPRPERCEHVLHEAWCSLEVCYQGDRSLPILLDDFAHAWIGEKPKHRWEQINVFPNLIFIRLSMATWVEVMLPVAPGRSQSLGLAFGNAGRRGRLHGAVTRVFLKRYLINMFNQLIEEDRRAIEGVQRGLECQQRPPGGVLSAREERVFHFQEYIVSKTGCDRWDAHSASAELRAA